MDIAQVSFTKGEASPIAAARTDAAFYQNALSLCLNFFVRAEGAVSNRPGLQFIAQCNSTPLGSYLIPFIYNNQQAYLVEMSSSPIGPSAGGLNVYSQGALITSIGTPYASSDLANIRWAQSADTLNLVVATQPPYQLKRVTVSSFTLTAPVIVNGPFQDLNTDGTTTVFASASQGVVTLTASSPIFTPQHVGALFTIQEQFLGSIQAWEANSALAISGQSPIGQYCRSDGKIYKCVDAPPQSGTIYTGQFQPVHLSGTQRDGTGKPVPGQTDSIQGVAWQFVSQDSGVALITAYIDANHVTAVVQSDKGVYSNFPPTVVGGPQNVVGPYAFTGNGSNVTFAPLTAITIGDPNQFYVTVNGIFQDPTTYSVNLGTKTLTFNTAPGAGLAVSIAQVTGTTNINPVSNTLLPGLALSTYWAFGSFSTVQGYPATVVYFNDRFVFGGTQKQPQTVFTSKTANYLDFGVSTPQVADDGITFTMNARRENSIVDLLPLSDLLIGTASGISRVTHSASSGSITPSDISLLPQNFYGQQNVPSVQTGDTAIYVQWGGRKVRDLVYQFQYDKFVGTELTVFARQMFPYGTTVTRMAYAPEPYGLLFCVRSDGVLCVCAYLPEQQVTAWSRYTTQGFFEDVCVLPENGTFAVYVIVRRVVNNTTVRYIERFAAREYATLQDAFFVDSALTYDGRNPGGTVTFTPNVAAVSIASVTAIQIGAIVDVFVNTSSPHNLANGQAIQITGVSGTGTFAINGNWTVDGVLSPTQIQLSGGPGTLTGTYTSGGAIVSTQPTAGSAGVVSCTSAVFQASDATNNNAVWINDASGNTLCRLQITAFLSPTLVSARALTLVPASVPGVAQPWTFAKTVFSGLTNLAGQMVAVYADGGTMPSQMVSGTGSFTLPNAAGVIHAGLPYTCQLQSLSPNVQGQPPIRDHAKTITRLAVVVDQSAPFYAGPNFNNLTQFSMREFENYGQPTALHTGVLQQNLSTTLEDDLTICIQHVDPVPLTILAWIADIQVGETG